MLLKLAAAGESVRRTACLESITYHRPTREQSTCLSPKAQASNRQGKAQVKSNVKGHPSLEGEMVTTTGQLGLVVNGP